MMGTTATVERLDTMCFFISFELRDSEIGKNIKIMMTRIIWHTIYMLIVHIHVQALMAIVH